jgi:transcriptional regulator NrdR family protein
MPRGPDDKLGLACPRCGAPTWVHDSRPGLYFGQPCTRRRRYCKACGHRFTSWEIIGGTFDAAKLRAIIASAHRIAAAAEAVLTSAKPETPSPETE